MKASLAFLLVLTAAVSSPRAQETFQCLERIRKNQALSPEERKSYLQWMEMAGYPRREKNVRKLHPIFRKYPSFSLEMVKCYLNTKYGSGLDDEKYGILDDLPNDLRALLVEYSISLFKSNLNTELSKFFDCWGKLLLDMDSSGFKTESLMDSTKLNGYNELLLKNAILSNYHVQVDTASQLEKTRRAYEKEFKDLESWYNPAQDTDAIIEFYRKVGRKEKFRENEIPFIVVP